MIDWKVRARLLVQRLVDAGVLDENWRDAFENTPRHVFVPRFYRPDMTVLDGSDPREREEWLAAVYSDDSLTTQYAQVSGTDLMWPTSSSTKPSLMARMLGLLDAHPGHRVLEIGTGTGYHTALLCHRLGDRNAVSIDIDPDLVAAARARLAELDRHPLLVSGDGGQPIPDAAPFDRIIATCAVPAVPPAWIGQLRDGGVIVTDLRGELASNLTVLHKTSPATVQGRFQAIPGHFMWLRPQADNPLRDGNAIAVAVDRDHATQRPTRLDPGVLDHPDLRFLLQLHDPAIGAIWRTVRSATELLCVHSQDGAWAEVDVTGQHGRYSVTQGGSRQIWTQIEHTAALWSRLGQPRADRFGLTATIHYQLLWLDHPDSEHTWRLPSQPDPGR